MNADKRPLMVTILCCTYNHEPYIRQCLEGFVMQKTNFRFEAIVHDDASTDGTAAIVKEYAEKYPDIIKPIFETENQYSKHDGSLERIMNEHTHGKYVALCEGDDYWIDPLKLQKQVDFLEGHLDCSMCFHRAKVIYEDGVSGEDVFAHVIPGYLSLDYLLRHWTVATCSMIYRHNVIEEVPINRKFVFTDNVYVLTCFKVGKVYCINGIMSVYRRNAGGWTFSKEKQEMVIALYRQNNALIENFPELDLSYLRKVNVRRTAYILVNMHKNLPKDIKLDIQSDYRNYPLYFILCFIEELVKRFIKFVLRST